MVGAVALFAGCHSGSKATVPDGHGGKVTSTGGVAVTTAVGGSSAGGGGGQLSAGAGGIVTTGTADGALALNATEVCRAAITAQCQRENYCTLDWGRNFEDCLKHADFCPDYYFSADSNRTVAEIAACIAEIATRPCSDIPFFIFPPCLVGGKRAGGAGCSFNSQCQSGQCNTATTMCFTCATPPGAGSKCPTTGLCQLGTYCHPRTNLCTDVNTVIHAAEGQPCDLGASPSVACQGDLVCQTPANSGSSAGTCMRGLVAGDVCKTSSGQFTCGPGTVCTDSTGGTCELPGTCGTGLRCDDQSYCRSAVGFSCAHLAAVGEACTMSRGDGLPPCLYPLHCMGSPGKCVARPTLGQPCDTNNSCVPPTSCMSGICQKLTAESCPP
jgi:hypothetical protein